MSVAYRRSFDYFAYSGLDLTVAGAETTVQEFAALRTTLAAKVSLVTGSWTAGTVVNVEGWNPLVGSWLVLASFSGEDTRHDVFLGGVTSTRMKMAVTQAGAATIKCEWLVDVEQDRTPPIADSVQHGSVKLYTANEQTYPIDVGRSAGLKLYIASQTWSTAVVTWEKSQDGLNWSGFDTPVTSSADGLVELDVRGWRFVRGRVSTASATATYATFAAHSDTNVVVPQSTGSAPSDAAYIVSAASSVLTAERVVTDTGTVAWDTGTASQLKANVPDASITEAKQVLADNTTQDVSTSKHGYVPKAPNDTNKFLRGDASWSKLPSGTYTPTHTSVANMDSTPTSPNWHYLRCGDVVTVSGPITFDPTSGNMLTRSRISLPVASNFANVEDCSGVLLTDAGLASNQGSGIIKADVTNNEAELSWFNGINTGSKTAHAHFTYRVI